MTKPSATNKYVAVAALLIDIEGELRTLGWWDAVPPPDEALSSTMPFGADKLEFYQWVQFVFLPRMYVLIDQHLPLPTACGIAPMLEEYSRVSGRASQRLLRLFASLDTLIGAAAS